MLLVVDCGGSLMGLVTGISAVFFHTLLHFVATTRTLLPPGVFTIAEVAPAIAVKLNFRSILSSFQHLCFLLFPPSIPIIHL